MIREALLSVPGVEICGLAESCAQALQLVRTLLPNAVTLDLSLTDGSSIPLIPRLLEACPGLLLIVFSLNVDPIIRSKVLQAGAAYCFNKDAGVDPIVSVVKASTISTSL